MLLCTIDPEILDCGYAFLFFFLDEKQTKNQGLHILGGQLRNAALN